MQRRESPDDQVLQPVERYQRHGLPAEKDHGDHGQQVYQQARPGERVAISPREQVRIEKALH